MFNSRSFPRVFDRCVLRRQLRRLSDAPQEVFTSTLQRHSKPSTSTTTIGESASPKKRLPVSSVPAGTSLKGLSYIKGKPNPVALKESEYPAWLWDVLESRAPVMTDATAEVQDAKIVGELFSKSKKERKAASKRLRKLQKDAEQDDVENAHRDPFVPITEQSIDLPCAPDTMTKSQSPSEHLHAVVDAQNARHELTRALRYKRRRDIREENYLRGLK